MKIGLFSDCYYPQVNGVVTSVMMLKEELEHLGHQVTIITAQMPEHKKSTPDVIRIKSIPFSKWKEFRLAIPFLTTAYRKIKDLNLDVIHTHTEFSIGLLGRYCAARLNIPLVHTYHTMYEDYTHYVTHFKYTKKIAKKLIIQGSKSYVKPATAIIAPSEKTKLALKRYGVKNYIHVLPTGVDIQYFNSDLKDESKLSQLRSQYGLSPDDQIILSLGRVSEEKSIDTIIDQIPTLISVNPRIKLLIVGDGPYKDKLVEQVAALNINDYVVFAGRIPFTEVGLHYQLADLFVSASKTETQGLTIMEAMATKTPVIVYDDDNVKDLVVHNYSGLLFKNGITLADHIITTISSPEKKDYLAENGIKMVKSLSKESFGQGALAIYIDLIRYKGSYEISAI